MTKLLAFLFALLPFAANAQPTGAQAEVLFREGKRLIKVGKIADACEAFDASQKLEEHPATVLNQADCRERLGQIATAWGLFLKVRSAAQGDPRLAEPLAIARQRSSLLEARLSTLTIAITQDAQVGGLEIRRGDQLIERALWNKALPVDGGTYTVRARAPGNAEWSSTVTVGNERDARTIEIPILKAAELQPTHTDPLKPTPVPAPTPIAPTIIGNPRVVDPPRRLSRVPLYVGAGAVVALGVALALEVSARGVYDDATSDPDPMRQLSLWDSANTRRYVAEGIAIAGVTAGGVAVWMWIRNRRTERRVQVAPLGVGLQLVGGF